MDTRLPKRWSPDDPIEAARLNEMLDSIQACTHAPYNSSPEGDARIYWVRLKEWLGPAADFDERNGARQFFDYDTGEWKDCDPEEEVKVSDPSGKLCCHEGAIVPCWPHQSGKLVPLSDGQSPLLCKATASISGAGVKSTYIILTGTPGSETDSGVSVPPAYFYGGSTIANNAKLLLHRVQNGWVIAPFGGGGSVEGEEVTYLTGWRYNSTTKKIQVKTQTAKVIEPAAESAWTDAHTLASTEIAAYLGLDEHMLTWSRQQAWVMEVGEETEASLTFTLKTFIKRVYTAAGNLLKQTKFTGYVVDPSGDTEETIDAGTDCDEEEE